MIILDTDVLIEIFDRRSEKGDEALRGILESGDSISRAFGSQFSKTVRTGSRTFEIK